MRIVLEVVSDPNAGRTLLLRPGQVAKIGRTEWSDLALAHDGHMSSVHFSLKCEVRACRVCDLDSTNGTFLNGQRVIEATVVDGDEIVAGHTKFVVHIQDAPVAVGETTRPLDLDGNAAPSAPAGQVPQGAKMPAPAAAPSARPGSTARLRPFPRGMLDSSRPYDKALEDEDLAVRREALLAAAWTRQKWLLEYCRDASGVPSAENWDVLMLLGILGQASDLARILTIGRTAELGPRRYQVLGAFGHPGVMASLLSGINDKDAATAVAAGLAFSKITGAEIDSDKLVSLTEQTTDPEKPTEGMPDEAILPNPQLAMDHWNDVSPRFSQGTRWCRGFDLTRGATDDVLSQLDMESRFEACLRGKYEGTWVGCLVDLERFPMA